MRNNPLEKREVMGHLGTSEYIISLAYGVKLLPSERCLSEKSANFFITKETLLKDYTSKDFY